jgi:hypothetical protein
MLDVEPCVYRIAAGAAAADATCGINGGRQIRPSRGAVQESNYQRTCDRLKYVSVS